MPRTASPFKDRTIPKVAKRIPLAEHLLRRGVRAGDVKVNSWAGVDWISASEEARIAALVAAARTPVAVPDQESSHESPASEKQSATEPVTPESDAAV